MDSNLMILSYTVPLQHTHLSKFFIHFHALSSISVLKIRQSMSVRLSRLATTSCSNGRTLNGVGFDEAAFESERLGLDAEARQSMADTSEKEMEDSADENPKAWKWVIRKRIWDLMEAQNIACNPRPVHHRIPNFVGAFEAANKLSELEVFQNAQCVKVNPDTPQKNVRFLTLTGGKKLLTPQPRLRTGFFSVIDYNNNMLTPASISEACTSVGVAKYGRAIGLDEKIKVDLIVIGSVAVNPRTGARLGKGEGFAELEYGMLRYMGAIDDSTPVVTTINDCQLVDDIPVEKLLIHDVPVDIICTPTEVIFTKTSIPKPQENSKVGLKSRPASGFPPDHPRNYLRWLNDKIEDRLRLCTEEEKEEESNECHLYM